MKLLYVNNFRGFKNATIPIKNVNFLVGENSTGKSSVLALLRVLQDPLLRFESLFKSSDIYLGNFKEIINNPNDDSFTIGLCTLDKENNNITTDFSLISFTNDAGEPVPSRYTFLESNNKLVTTFFHNKSIDLLVEQIEVIKDIDGLSSILQKAVAIHLNKRPKELKRILIEIDKRQRLMFARNFLAMVDHSNAFSFKVPTFGNLTWIAPIRETPKRVYSEAQFKSTPEGGHIPYILKELIQSTKDEKTLAAITKFGKESGLFYSIEVEAFSKEKTSPFELYIELESGKYKISNVGYGVAQILPIVVEILRSNNSIFCIQQPEVHLHPKAQAAFGELVYDTVNSKKHSFLIETHSEYVMDRFRLKLAKGKQKLSSQILFFEKGKQGNTVYPINIEKDGSISEAQPKTYRDFFIKEELSLLGM